jgi:hypothetical protein
MKAIYRDCCLPDYFLGSSRPLIVAPVWPDMTYGEALQSAKDSLIHCDEIMDDNAAELALNTLFEPVDLSEPADFAKYVDNEECYLYIEIDQAQAKQAKGE